MFSFERFSAFITVLPLPREPIQVSTNCDGFSSCADAYIEAKRNALRQIIVFISSRDIYYRWARAMQGAKKKTPAKSVFFAFGENYASYFLKSNAPLCPPNPKFVLIATFTSAFLATFGT